jgi:hypothetical protein
MPTKKLTDLFVERAKPPASGRIEYFDASIGSLALHVTSQGQSPSRWFIALAAVCWWGASDATRRSRYKTSKDSCNGMSRSPILAPQGNVRNDPA